MANQILGREHRLGERSHRVTSRSSGMARGGFKWISSGRRAQHSDDWCGRLPKGTKVCQSRFGKKEIAIRVEPSTKVASPNGR
jgi:hypothetical protein